MPKYTPTSGKHRIGKNKETGEAVYVREGETIELSEAEAKQWPGKFKLVANDPPPAPAPAAEGKTPSQAAK